MEQDFRNLDNMCRESETREMWDEIENLGEENEDFIKDIVASCVHND